MTVEEVREGDLVLARYIPADAAWNDGLTFFSGDDDYVQVGTWQYPAGKQLLAHTHNEVTRSVLWTQEALLVRNGKIRASIYDTHEVLVKEFVVSEGDIIILLRGGHGYEILEDNTQVLEIKNGPYVGADADRRRL
jgi:hypothetical protein